MPDRLGRRGLRTVRGSLVRAGTGHFGTHAEPGTGLPSQPWQPVQSPVPGTHRPRRDARPVGPAGDDGLAGRVRRRRLHLGALRRADQPRAGLLLLGVQTLGRPAHRRRLVLPVDHPARLGLRLLDRAGDAVRIPPTADATTFTIEQVTRLVQRLPDDGPVPMFVFDAGYDPIAIGAALTDTAAQVLVRIRGDRVFYTDPSHRAAAAIGRPRRHGTRFALSDTASAPVPTAELSVQDKRHGKVHVSSWTGLHPKLGCRGHWANHDHPPIVAGTVIRVDVEHLPKPSPSPRKTLWLWWSGPGEPDLDLCWRAYLRRFDIEHTFRFVKSTLGWTTPALQTPDQAHRWTWLVVAAYTQLRLARGLVDDQRLPWERPRDPAKLTPARGRRGFRRLRPTLGTPASAPKSDRPGPGRPKNTRRPPRTRYPAVKKAA